ncbi:hypothetical protein GBZ48_21535 [Azospirillum melinis]|uniref:HNH nuclease domain-containing protein n=1 Tax=Azospirillum melinis TaxID=328839 RepID=A0ABX2KJ78_9PROT|nr:HNH endonuclease signature motif containing protein [Azospirillum melinis]MBP2309403.1 hypothetical protein [Azospirillum melinis]NUB01838.1 hypothetical protein [Azospirillum melinis]
MPDVYASTDPEWFSHLASLVNRPARVAFWRPTYTVPTEISVGVPWFFKQRGAPFIVGYGRFVEHESTTPARLWTKFGSASGAPTQETLLAGISAARKGGATLDTGIGNVTLSDFTVFTPPLTLGELELPNLTGPYRYVPKGNRLLSYAEGTPVAPLPYKEPGPASRRELHGETFARNVGHVARIRQLYGGVCQISGEPILDGAAGDLTQVHHIDFLCDGGADDPSNMMALSPNWHAIAHAPGTTFDWTTLEFVVGMQRFGLALNRHLKPR